MEDPSSATVSGLPDWLLAGTPERVKAPRSDVDL